MISLSTWRINCANPQSAMMSPFLFVVAEEAACPIDGFAQLLAVDVLPLAFDEFFPGPFENASDRVVVRTFVVCDVDRVAGGHREGDPGVGGHDMPARD